MRPIKPVLGTLMLILGLMAAPVWAATPTADGFPVASLEMIDHYQAPTVDEETALLEDDDREIEGLPPRFAIPFAAGIDSDLRGTWEDLGNGNQLWRQRISSPGAKSINLSFSRFALPETASLLIYAADRSEILHAFTAADNSEHGQLWTPLLRSDDIVVELTVSTKAADRVELEIGSVNVGYRGFASMADGGRSGSCNNDVVCPEGDDWRAEIPSVGVYTVNGVWYCTGAMINNTAQDGTPYFLTANHCGVTTSNDQAVVIYWNFESPNCGDQGGGSLSQYNSGVIHRVSYSASDMTLVELEEPLNPAHEVTYSGWDRSTGDQPSAVAIHHPSTDEKAISFEYDPTTTTTYLQNSVPGNGTHIRVTDWDDGTTEPGSSGSPLYSPDHKIVGQLHGGYASCTSQTSDWYGRLSYSMDNSSLEGYLDPLGTGQMTVDTWDPLASGMLVSPGAGLVSEGDQGGPFTPSSLDYTIENAGESGFNFSVSDDASWVSVAGGSGYLSPGGTATVTVSLNAGANALAMGLHTATVSFLNTSSGDGDTTRPVSLQVGVPSLQWSESMDSDPGWTTQGQWAFGSPTGGGGADHGNADPGSGFDGPNVYGYNLNGDYTNNMSETHLTSEAIDCSELSAVSLKFRRWLNVEQPTYDHAYVRVSNNGSTWTTVWENGGEITDNSWQEVEYDISGVADGESAVYLRWTMGTTDGSWLYSGWNVDNVELWGLGGGTTATENAPAPTKSGIVSNMPNPFNPKTEIRYALAEAGAVELAIFDVAGRQVATLLEGRREAGSHSATWNGTDDAGNSVSSGIYFARLKTEAGLVDTSKLTLLK